MSFLELFFLLLFKMFRSTQKIYFPPANKIGSATPSFFEKGVIDSVDVMIPYTASVELLHMSYVRTDKWQIEYLTTWGWNTGYCSSV